MKRNHIVVVVALIILTSSAAGLAQRRGGGGGRSFGGGGRSFSGGGTSMGSRSMGGGFSSAARSAPRSAPAARPMVSPSQGRVGIGPGGGSFQANRGSGGFTTPGGSSIDFGGRGISGTGPGGISAGRGVGGIKLTTPSGQEFAKAGRVGGIQGPGGNAIGGSRGFAGTNGPAGSGASFSRGGFASGPHDLGAFRGGVAVGPSGVVAGRTGIAANGHGTYFRSAGAVRGQGVAVRAGAVGYHGCFTNTWCARYPGAWYPRRWGAAAAWTAVTWSAIANYGGYASAQPVSYDYGSTVVYQDNSVYINGDAVGTAVEYSEQATTIAETGKDSDASQEEEWQPLGVFAMVQGEEQSSNNIFQLAINKEGVIRGNYYNAVTDTTEEVYGSVDKQTQRAAWMVGDAEKPVYEAGLVNLTKDDTPMMVHYANDRSVQATLFRIKQDGDQSQSGAEKE